MKWWEQEDIKLDELLRRGIIGNSKEGEKMTRPFCDLCGEECRKESSHEVLEVQAPYGKEFTRVTSEGPKVFQTRIVARMVFSFKNHETGFAGPHDLCDTCKAVMTHRLGNHITNSSLGKKIR